MVATKEIHIAPSLNSQCSPPPNAKASSTSGSYSNNDLPNKNRVGLGLAEMLKGGVIMDVMTVEQAVIAEKAGAVAVMALECIPSDIRKNDNDVVRMSDIGIIEDIMKAVSIPVMAKVRIGHFVEATILQELGVDFIDESEVLTIADNNRHINKHNYEVPFVCGARDLGEALRRISEGACMIRSKGEAGTGNVVEAVNHINQINKYITIIESCNDSDVYAIAKELMADVSLVQQVKKLRRLPVVNFAAGGIATPADAAMCMQLGCDGVFVGSGIFRSENPEKRARAIVQAVTHFNNPAELLKASRDLGRPMKGVGNLSKVENWSQRESEGYVKVFEVNGSCEQETVGTYKAKNVW